MEGKTIISCQISFYPLNTNKVNKKVKKVIHFIDESGLEYESNDLSTIIHGEATKVYSLLEEITYKMDEGEFAITLNISNSCGCERD
ncbi:MAG TPA: YkoF family thiamine/hydroxymethylpyrimidine-binding protein [Halanaerobiales bacterium]|nr:YkoF family thiamine/hydroxymethylpyrimidine-binding protein [Halanaerobiales bacterium]